MSTTQQSGDLVTGLQAVRAQLVSGNELKNFSWETLSVRGPSTLCCAESIHWGPEHGQLPHQRAWLGDSRTASCSCRFPLTALEPEPLKQALHILLPLLQCQRMPISISSTAPQLPSRTGMEGGTCPTLPTPPVQGPMSFLFAQCMLSFCVP